MGNFKVEHEGLCKNLLILSSELPVPGVGGTYIERFFVLSTQAAPHRTFLEGEFSFVLRALRGRPARVVAQVSAFVKGAAFYCQGRCWPFPTPTGRGRSTHSPRAPEPAPVQQAWPQRQLGLCQLLLCVLRQVVKNLPHF